MLEVTIRPLAKKDFKSIWQYGYKNWGVRQADFYTEQLGKTIKSLPDNPKIGIAIDDILEGYRMYHFERHLIVYRILPRSIEVVRVL